jgi:hypothetical protein
MVGLGGGHRARVRCSQWRERREEEEGESKRDVGASLSPQKGNGSGGHLLAGIDGGQLTTEQFAEQRKMTGRLDGLGLRWAFAGKGEGKNWAGNGPRQGRVPFVFKSLFLIFYFPKSFAILQKDFADPKLFMKT